jgi:GTP 3',8-cyclase
MDGSAPLVATIDDLARGREERTVVTGLRPEPPLPPAVSIPDAGEGADGVAIRRFERGRRDPSQPADLLDRPLRDLRISVTDRCNFRCVYCMPREIYGRDFAFLPRAELLSFEEITRAARAFVALGVEKLRLTGGEPLVRRDLPRLVEQLAVLRTRDGRPLDLTLTTNGAGLRALAQPLADAGLQRVTVSLDALDDATFRAMNDVDFPVDRVRDGIDAAREAGLAPIKVNAVVRRGLNEQEIVPLARWARDEGLVLRFIEYMDVGHSNGWRLDDVVPAAEIVALVDRELPLDAVPPAYRGEVAQRYGFSDGSGEIGVISSVSAPFCGDCTRARLSADGTLYTCLFSSRGWDIRGRLRHGFDDRALETFLGRVWSGRDDRYSELRTAATDDLRADPRRIEMFAMGG